MTPPGALVLYDGVCHLCQGLVRFVVDRDPSAQFVFAPLQSPVARRWVPRVNVGGARSVILVEGDAVYTKSTAALRIARRLGLPWALAYGLVVLPRVIRDAVYDWVARNRYRWFGRSDVCDRPGPDVMARMVGDAFEGIDEA